MAIVMTNKRAISSKRRKPGGGRKPVGPVTGKTSNFSTRITQATRGALEAEAAASGHSISQVAERLLQSALKERREKLVDGPLRALAFVQAALANACTQFDTQGRRFEWKDDPFTFEAFRLALAMMIERLRPPGEIVHPLGRTEYSPSMVADQAWGRIWSQVVANQSPASPEQIQAEWDMGRGRERLPPDVAAGISRVSYAFSDAARDLKLNLRERKE